MRGGLTPEGVSYRQCTNYNYGSSSSLAVAGGEADCFVGDFAGGGLAGAEAVCGEFDCFFEGSLPTVRYLRILSSFLGPMPLMASRSSTLLKAP